MKKIACYLLFTWILSPALLMADGNKQSQPPAKPTAKPKITIKVEPLKNSKKEEAQTAKQSPVEKKGLTKEEANRLISSTLKDKIESIKKTRKQEFDQKAITLGDKKMRFDYRVYGNEPKDGHSLYISLHGGGNAPARVNDQQWQNQINLYRPKEGVYVAPRAPTNTWNLWHQGHIDPLLDRLIADFIAFKGINPNKVYIMGYSAGGDGLYQLAPRMADRWAGAAMMAGHPGDAQAYNLRNLPFIIQCGGKDAAYKRNLLCAEWGKKLDRLSQADKGAYPHKCIVYPKFGHWMNRKDAIAVPWMAKNTRVTWPKKVHWYQDDVTHTRFYWLENPSPKPKQLISAEVDGQTITLFPIPPQKDKKGKVIFEKIPSITLRLSDALLDLDKEIVVKNGDGKILFKGKVLRSQKEIEKSLSERPDASSCATASLKITF